MQKWRIKISFLLALALISLSVTPISFVHIHSGSGQVHLEHISHSHTENPYEMTLAMGAQGGSLLDLISGHSCNGKSLLEYVFHGANFHIPSMNFIYHAVVHTPWSFYSTKKISLSFLFYAVLPLSQHLSLGIFSRGPPPRI